MSLYRIELFRGQNRQWYWRIRARNGRVLARPGVQRGIHPTRLCRAGRGAPGEPHAVSADRGGVTMEFWITVGVLWVLMIALVLAFFRGAGILSEDEELPRQAEPTETQKEFT